MQTDSGIKKLKDMENNSAISQASGKISNNNIMKSITRNNNGKDRTGKVPGRLEGDNKIELGTWGFREAGKNNGDLNSLVNKLYYIFNGYLSELTGKQNQQTNDIRTQIDEVKENITDVSNQITHIEKQEIPGQQQEIEDFKNEIEKTRIDAEAGFIDSDFNWVKTILFTLFSVMLGMSLVFFYTSLIYNGLFKDVGETLRSSTIDNSASIFNTLLDVKSLFTFDNTGIIISYLFSSIFLTMGLLLHTKSNIKTKAGQIENRIEKGVLLVIALAAEIIFAYKIEKNIDELKSLTVPDYVPAHSWQNLLFSVDVLIVITLGFIGYIIWSFALEGAFVEWNKRNPKKLASIKIRELEKKINRRKYKISEFRNAMSALQGNLNALNQKLEILKRKLNLVIFQPVELEERLEAFFGGWLKYINNHEDLKNSVARHQEVFLTAKERLINNEPENLLSN